MKYFGMDIYEKTITLANGSRFRFVCRGRDTRSGFAHDVDLYYADNWPSAATSTIYYLNRTWEAYRFQTAICDCIRKAKACAEYDVESAVKKQNGWSRITSARRPVLEDAIANNAWCNLLDELLQEVHSNNPKWD